MTSTVDVMAYDVSLGLLVTLGILIAGWRVSKDSHPLPSFPYWATVPP